MLTTSETEDLLIELQRAADDHRRILNRQSELIRRLREELRDVRHDDPRREQPEFPA